MKSIQKLPTKMSKLVPITVRFGPPLTANDKLPSEECCDILRKAVPMIGCRPTTAASIVRTDPHGVPPAAAACPAAAALTTAVPIELVASAPAEMESSLEIN